MHHKRQASTEVPRRTAEPSAQKRPRPAPPNLPTQAPRAPAPVPLLIAASRNAGAKQQVLRWKLVEKEALQAAIRERGLGDNDLLSSDINKKGVNKSTEQVRMKLTKKDMRKWLKDNAASIPGLNSTLAFQTLHDHYAQGGGYGDEEELDDDELDDEGDEGDEGDSDNEGIFIFLRCPQSSVSPSLHPFPLPSLINFNYHLFRYIYFISFTIFEI